jgi:hypothetical protein
MRLLNIFSKKPLKRIELKAHSKNSKFRIRASRTGGINAAIHPLRGLTFNTKHGIRASKTFKGLTLGFQGGNSIVRGRWSSKNGLLNLNLSKSGFTLSSKNEYGTYNISKPNRSSFKFAGVQLRGKKAAPLAAFFFLSTIGDLLLPPLFRLLGFLFRAVGYLLLLAIKILINISIILLRVFAVIYHLILFVMIDVPKQIINNLSQKEIVDDSDESEVKINKDQSFEDDKSTVNGLNERLESYSRNYSEITIFEKIKKIVLAFVGFGLACFGVIGIFLSFAGFLSFATGEGSLDGGTIIMAVVSVCSFILGRRLLKPLFEMIRHKKDYDLKKILEEKIEITKKNQSPK